MRLVRRKLLSRAAVFEITSENHFTNNIFEKNKGTGAINSKALLTIKKSNTEIARNWLYTNADLTPVIQELRNFLDKWEDDFRFQQQQHVMRPILNILETHQAKTDKNLLDKKGYISDGNFMQMIRRAKNEVHTHLKAVRDAYRIDMQMALKLIQDFRIQHAEQTATPLDLSLHPAINLPDFIHYPSRIQQAAVQQPTLSMIVDPLIEPLPLDLSTRAQDLTTYTQGRRGLSDDTQPTLPKRKSDLAEEAFSPKRIDIEKSNDYSQPR